MNLRRVIPSYRFRLAPLDLAVAAALLSIPVSYYLGLGVDWSQEGGSEEREAGGAWGVGAAPVPPAAIAAMPPGAEAPRAARGSDPEEREWSEMVRRLQIEAISYPGRVAIFLKDMKRDRAWTHQPDDLFPSASLIKVPVMAAAFEKINSGDISLRTKVALKRRHRVGGSGSIKWYRDGAQFTVRQLLEKMMEESDNTATKMVIETVGLGFIQEQFPKMGLLYTEIYPEGLSLKGSRVSYENYTTAREISLLLEKMYRGELVSKEASELMMDFMKHKRVRARLAKGLPSGWEIAHKTGLLRGACHDSAIVFTPRGDYVLTVLTGQNRSYSRAKDFITRLGRITYRYYRSDRGQVASSRRHGADVD